MIHKLQSLKVRMPLIIIGLFVLAIAVLVVVTQVMVTNTINKVTYSGFDNTVMGYASLMDTWFEDQLDIAKVYVKSDPVRNYLTMRTEETRDAALIRLRVFNEDNQYTINMGITDINGNVLIDASNASLIGQNIFSIHPDLRQKVQGNRDAAFGDNITRSLTTGGWSLVLISKVYDRVNNRVIGYLYYMLDWSYLIKERVEQLVIGETGALFCVDDTLTIKIHSKIENINSTAPQDFSKTFEDKKGIINYVFNGEDRVAAYTTLTYRPWVLGVSMTKQEIEKDNVRVVRAIIIISLVSIIIIAILVSLFIKSITTPLGLITGLSKEIADGDLRTTKQKIFRKDELGELSNAFVAMRKKLVATIHKVEDSANQISAAAKELAEQNTDLSRRTESQAASIEETSASMNEISNNIRQSSNDSVNGNKMIMDSKDAIENAGNIISETTKNIEEVHEASSKIKDITKIIEDIAFQTNILALNASVEAARAGEQGKGFAVVASEVRNLAQTTQTSVKSITDLIENVYNKIDKATETARESQTIFVEIQNKIDEASTMMQNISHSAVEQQSGIDQIKIAIEEMDTTTQRNAALVEEATASADVLFSQSKELMDAIHIFQLPENNSDR
ncbi:methyl-accepting chemotaxis protein [uncultured Brachyspira sp.]|jgi:methyl-accepting chemotaxis protein-1 (serine sensor receptor)|uniref:methyl-accepting chemotaxis protein n=1 Tax=uncultured Brachyspira sp. TaxID=221953 RepID=UPI00258B06ED|nr:methyl-accepting chemotaxis protein [uncultured Brachyspira sp.]